MGESLPLNDFEASPVTPEEELNVESSNLQERLHAATETIRAGYNDMRQVLSDRFSNVITHARGGFRLATGAAAVSLMVACSSGKAQAETPTPTPVAQTTPGADVELSTPTVVNLGTRQSKAQTSSTTVTSSKFVEPGGSVEETSEEPTSVTAPNKGETSDDTTPNSEVTVEENSHELNFKLPKAEDLAEGPVVILTEISGVDSLTFSPEDLTGGIDLGLKGVTLEPKVGQTTYRPGSDLVKFLEKAGYNLSPEDEKKILAMRIDYGKSQQGDSGVYRFEFINGPVVITDERGNSFTFNPYGISENGLVLKPVSKDTSPLEVKSATITDSKGDTTNLSLGHGETDEAASTVVQEPKKLVIKSGEQTPSSGNPISGSGASESESKLASSSTEVLEENIGNIDWDIEWEADESFSVRIWLEDMIAKGYIKIDSTAERYAGDEIYRFKENFFIVPVPENYYSTGSTYYARVSDALEKLARDSMGHIIVDPRAKESLPEGAELYVPGSVSK